MRNILRFSVLTALACVPAMGDGGTLTGGATFPEQIVQEVTLIQSQMNGAERLVEQIQQYENMVQNTATLPQSMVGQILQPIDQLYGLVGQAESLGTNAQNIAQQFQNMNASFNPQITQQYVQHYQGMTSALQDAINTALQTANLNPNNFATEAQAQQTIQQALQNPNSRNALLQASAAVGQATVTDLTQMLQTMNAEATAEETWRKQQLNEQQYNQGVIGETMSNLLGEQTTPPPPLTGNPMDAFNPPN
jgi:P-type conjugative transfer protein TrbJ